MSPICSCWRGFIYKGFEPDPQSRASELLLKQFMNDLIYRDYSLEQIVYPCSARERRGAQVRIKAIVAGYRKKSFYLILPIKGFYSYRPTVKNRASTKKSAT